ncbi:MAG: hypothetical protein EBU66_20330, partial [Bacteroidetes bacterium]|nr:hypothetical protein [Bacteroidota bacterium]
IFFNYVVYSQLKQKLIIYLDKNATDLQDITLALKQIKKYNNPMLLLVKKDLYLYRKVVLNDAKLELIDEFISN